MACAFATVGHKDEKMFAARAVVAQQRMKDFDSQHIESTAWEFAMVGHEDDQLSAALAVVAQQFMQDFNSQDSANKA